VATSETPHATTVVPPSEEPNNESEGETRTFDETEWGGAQEAVRRFRIVSAIAASVILPFLCVPALLIGGVVGSGLTGALAFAGILVGFSIPLAVGIVVVADRQQSRNDEHLRAMAESLREAVLVADKEAAIRNAQARRQLFESRLANALDMAEGEPEVIDVIERSFETVLPDAPIELLLADNSHAHLKRMAGVGPDGKLPGCSVDSPDRCPAARRAQIQVFADSDALDACPKLRHRQTGAVSAICVPVSMMGRAVGVIHAMGQPHASVDDDRLQDLATLAKLAGSRMGLLRVMAETQLQAATDTLTGLLNRRAFEEHVASIRVEHSAVAVAMADLDHFKTLNDTYGHETGDRALRLFARVLREAVRATDCVARHGGEEFAVAFAGCTGADAQRAIDAVRARLDAAVTVAGLPQFTMSVGVTDMGADETLSAALERADQALFAAKKQGRDRVVLYGAVDPPVPRPEEDLAGGFEDLPFTLDDRPRWDEQL
jgi:diguanylate cyclase (GGDEF)-like protein